MSVHIPQYARTDRADVIEVIERNINGVREFGARAQAFADKYSDLAEPRFWRSAFAGDYRLVAIDSRNAPTVGQWTRGHRGGWRPYKSNPAYAEMTAIRFRAERIPGTPTAIEGQWRPDGSRVLMSPSLFVHDGLAWFHLSSEADPDQRGTFNDGDPFDPGIWTEVLGSEWHAANEAHTGKAVTR